jgi:hypothetical protein
MTRHTHTEDFTMDAHPRQIIRTAESILAEQDARLASMTPRDKPTPDEWARGFRDAVAFMFVAFLVVYACLLIGGVQ